MTPFPRPTNFRINSLANSRVPPALGALAYAVLSACTPMQVAPNAPDREPPNTTKAAPVKDGAHPLPTTDTTAEITTSSESPSLYLGSGQFSHVPQRREAGTDDHGTAQLSFVDVDIKTVIDSVLGEGLGVPYNIDPAVKGTLTLQSSKPLSKDALLPALEEALRLQDIALVPHGTGYDIVPLKSAQQHVDGLRDGDAATRAGYAVEIVPLRYTGATEMNKVLEPFARSGAVVRVDESRNLLVLAGTSGELQALLDVVQTFDVDWLSGMSFGMYPVHYVDAKTLSDELKETLLDGKSPMAGLVRVIPIARLNTVMVASQQAAYIDQIGQWIKRLDLGTSSPGRRLYVYDVQNSKADDLAHTLNQLFGLGGGTAQREGRSSSGLNASLSGGGDRGPTTYSRSDSGSAPGSTALGNGSIRELAGAPRTSGASASSEPSLESAGLRIVANEESNALLILATPGEFTTLEGAIKRLDAPPRQVLIEASLAEVTLNNDLKFGVQWKFNSSTGSTAFSTAADGSIAQQFPGFSYIYTGASNIQAVLNSLESITHVNVLSAPKLMVLNNHEAQIQVGDQVPILTQQAVGVGQSGAPIVNSVQQRDTGVILQVTPRVNQNGTVVLDIAQEVSAVVPTTSSSINSPTIQERRISSTVSVADGGTIALGGLITQNKTRGRDGIPFLQRIPVLGYLFGSSDVQNNRTELIVLIRPHVVRDLGAVESVTADLQREFHASELFNLIPHAKPPATP